MDLDRYYKYISPNRNPCVWHAFVCHTKQSCIIPQCDAASTVRRSPAYPCACVLRMFVLTSLCCSCYHSSWNWCSHVCVRARQHINAHQHSAGAHRVLRALYGPRGLCLCVRWQIHLRSKQNTRMSRNHSGRIIVGNKFARHSYACAWQNEVSFRKRIIL